MTQATAVGRFDADTHTYTMDGSPVSSVTQVLSELFPLWPVDKWYLQRGQAVHACAAMLARGREDFENDPQIDGQVTALRRFFREVRPVIEYPSMDVEFPRYSARYRYAGTPDLICVIDGKTMVLDWKASIPKTLPYQLAAYGLLACVKYGVGVHIRDDGTYKMTDAYALKRYQPEWLAMRTTFAVMERLGAIKTQEER